MGAKLAEKIQRLQREADEDWEIDSVIPIPETSRTAALECAQTLKKPFREGYVKNRYIARTFIMPGQEMRQKTVRLKLNTIKSEFRGKVVLLVDDSIVRGTTSCEIIQMARDAGAKKVFFASAAPPVRHPNVYGIDVPTRRELVAFNRTEEEIGEAIGADRVIYNDLEDVEEAVRSLNPTGLRNFDSSCFSGHYVTEEVTPEYLEKVDAMRGANRLGMKSPDLFFTTSITVSSKETDDRLKGVDMPILILPDSEMHQAGNPVTASSVLAPKAHMGSQGVVSESGSCESLNNA
jgi:amidophosphoribosyltransferase